MMIPVTDVPNFYVYRDDLSGLFCRATSIYLVTTYHGNEPSTDHVTYL